MKDRKMEQKTEIQIGKVSITFIRYAGTHKSKLVGNRTEELQEKNTGLPYYCYCAYVLRITRYSCFLLVMLTNTGIFLRGLKLCRESRSILVSIIGIQKENWG